MPSKPQPTLSQGSDPSSGSASGSISSASKLFFRAFLLLQRRLCQAVANTIAVVPFIVGRLLPFTRTRRRPQLRAYGTYRGPNATFYGRGLPVGYCRVLGPSFAPPLRRAILSFRFGRYRTRNLCCLPSASVRSTTRNTRTFRKPHVQEDSNKNCADCMRTVPLTYYFASCTCFKLAGRRIHVASRSSKMTSILPRKMSCTVPGSASEHDFKATRSPILNACSVVCIRLHLVGLRTPLGPHIWNMARFENQGFLVEQHRKRADYTVAVLGDD
jgi:hypothetical protein